MNSEVEEKEVSVEGLDLEEPFVVHFRSTKGVQVFQLSEEEIKISGLMKTMFLDNGDQVKTSTDEPFVFSEASDENLQIIVSYIKKCVVEGKENPPPEKPLPRKTLPAILGSDYAIFQEIMESDQSENDKLDFLSKLVMDVTYFDMTPLREKVCATIASMFVGKPLETIKTMVNYIEEKKE